MKIYAEKELKDFEFWNTENLTDEEFEIIEENLNELYPNGIGETELRDMFWFDFETIAEWINTTEDEIIERK